MMDGDELKGSMGLDKLRELIELLKANDIADFDLEKEGLKIGLKFQSPGHDQASLDMAQMARFMAASQPVAGVSPAIQAGATPPQAFATETAAQAASPVPPAENHHIVKSPIVGTFYEAPSPGAPAFVKVGDEVELGQVLCIVEAMKLMNEIESDV